MHRWYAARKIVAVTATAVTDGGLFTRSGGCYVGRQTWNRDREGGSSARAAVRLRSSSSRSKPISDRSWQPSRVSPRLTFKRSRRASRCDHVAAALGSFCDVIGGNRGTMLDRWRDSHLHRTRRPCGYPGDQARSPYGHLARRVQNCVIDRVPRSPAASSRRRWEHVGLSRAQRRLSNSVDIRLAEPTAQPKGSCLSLDHRLKNGLDRRPRWKRSCGRRGRSASVKPLQPMHR